MGQFVYVIRKRIKLSPEKAIFIFVKNILPPTGVCQDLIIRQTDTDASVHTLRHVCASLVASNRHQSGSHQHLTLHARYCASLPPADLGQDVMNSTTDHDTQTPMSLLTVTDLDGAFMFHRHSGDNCLLLRHPLCMYIHACCQQLRAFIKPMPGIIPKTS